jgi:hypothetical protein
MGRSNKDFSGGVTPSYEQTVRAVQAGKLTYEEGAEINPDYMQTLKSNGGFTGKALPKTSDDAVKRAHKKAGLND